MAPPLLKLVFVKGPRDGDSIEYKPGSTIRIGRIVRGNQIAIKDAGISTKHLRIVTDSENWIVHDLGSSNGTILNSNTLDPDTPVNLRHGDIIKLGECTSIVVNFVTVDEVPVPEEEVKLPPRPRRNNRRLAVATEPVPDPDPDPVETKPTPRGRTKKQDKAESKEDEPPPKRTRAATRSRTLEDTADREKELEVEVNSRVRRSQRVAAMTNVVVQEEDKKGKSRVRRGKNNIESVQNPIKLEIKDIPDEVEMNKATTSKRIANACSRLVNVKSEDICLEEQDDKITSRATKRKKNETAGDSLLNQAPKSRARKKVMESRINDVEEEKEEGALNNHVEEEKEEEKALNNHVEEEKEEGALNNHVEEEKEEGALNNHVEEEKEEGALNNHVEEEKEEEGALNNHVEEEREEEEALNNHVEEGALNNHVEEEREEEEALNNHVEEEALNCHVEEEDEKDNEAEKEDEREQEEETEKLQDTIEDEEIEKLEDTIEEERDSKSKEKVDDQVEKKVDLTKMTLGEWFDYIEVQQRKPMIEETEEMIEPMRSKALRVHKFIEEQKQAKEGTK